MCDLWRRCRRTGLPGRLWSLPAGACCGSGAVAAWSRRRRAVSVGAVRAGPGRGRPAPPADPRPFLSHLLAGAEMLGAPDPELAATMGFSGFGALRCGPGIAGRSTEGRGGACLGPAALGGGPQGRLMAGGANEPVFPVAPPAWSCWSTCGQAESVIQFPFSSFSGKKARTFDLEAMFEQTRRTAVERSRKVLGKKCELCQLMHFKTCFVLLSWGVI